MFHRVLLGVFNRYATRHGHLRKPGFPLFDRNGQMFGYIDSVDILDGRMEVRGWALSPRVGLSNAEQKMEGVPMLARQDVSTSYGEAEAATPGFLLNLPVGISPTVFWTEHGGEIYVYALPGIRRQDLMRLRLSQLAPFLRDGARSVAPAVHWLIHRDPRSVAQIKTRLGLNSAPRSQQLHKDAIAPVEAEAPADLPALPGGQITIIVPVYNGFDLLPEVFERVVTHTDLPWQLVVIEDRSSDDRVRPWLRAWHDGLGDGLRDQVMLIENDKNLGFIGSVNRGLEAALRFGGHAVLLNADALVPAGWASKLLRPMLEGRNVATVTPMSNDAEIFNAPVICARMALQPGQVDRINALSGALLGAGEVVEVPTGVGFCMAMSIEYLRALPQLDTVFGKGYGEEVDWCQRARQRGGRNLGLGSLFVEHRGGVSFGSVEKQKLMMRNGLLISRRYPTYDAEVQQFIGSDPLLTSRLAMGIAWAGALEGAEVLVYLVHDMGGGAEHYIERRASEDVAAGNIAIMLRVGGMSRWQIELQGPNGTTRGETDDTELVQRLLNILPRKTVVYSCGVGDRNPAGIPSVLLSLAEGAQDQVEILFHDYLVISPSYTLVDSDGIYRGVPAAQGNTDRVHEWLRPDGSRMTLEAWRRAWGKLMGRADVIRVFSEDSRRLVAEAYPAQSGKIEVTPHRLMHDVPVITPRQKTAGEVPVIGVLGNIGLHKGAAVLRDLSNLLARDKRARLVVIGNVDPAYPLAAPAIVTGSYRVSDIPGLVARHGIDCWLIPSVCPETFSFTTHEALATGMPVWSFDLGAQRDAVAKAAQERGQGGVIPLPQSAADMPELLDRIRGGAA